MLKNVVVLGGGSAGLMAALSLKTKISDLAVSVLRSPEIGVIGVGESTTPNLPGFLFEYLKLNRRKFYELAQPTWKLAVHFIWGPRGSFNYTFESQMEFRNAVMQRPMGYFCDEDLSNVNQQDALLRLEKAFVRQPTGAPGIKAQDPFHLENRKFVKALEHFCQERGVQIIDGKMEHATRGPQGVDELVLDDGRRLKGDFYIDASGFRAELLGKVLQEPFIPFDKCLFNDRALVGSWDRTDETILAYTTAETMDAGWCWRIDHEHQINRGYVYSSQFISDDQAREEFLRKNPKAIPADRPIKFRTGRYQRAWVENVMAVGNACGFVEPLESSALMVAAVQIERYTDIIRLVGDTSSMRDAFNREWAYDWDEIRNFLTIHFWPNTMLNTPYWKHCRNDTDLSHVKPLLEFYQENGPTELMRLELRSRGNLYGTDGFLAILVGNKVPYRNRYRAAAEETEAVRMLRAHYQNNAQQGVDVKEALMYIRHPAWRWAEEN